MSFYEYLRRLYIKELYLILIISIPLSIFLYFQLENSWLASAVIIGCVPTLVELYYLNREKNIKTHKPLVLPRTIHFISYYLIIMGLAIVYAPFRFEYLLFIPLGISATAFHPFFGKKLKNILFYFGLISAIGLFIFEFSSENFTDPLGLQNYIMIGYVFMLTAIFVFQANVVNERSKSQHKKDKKALELKLAELSHLTEEKDELTFKLIADFNRTVADMGADFELIKNKNNDTEIRKIAINGRKSAQNLSHFIDEYTLGRKQAFPTMNIKHVDLNELIVSELDLHYDLIQKHGIDMRFDPYLGDLFFSDKERIKTIVRNLIKNAIDFADATKSDNLLTVRVKAKHNAVELAIIDNGVGISENSTPHIFKMFYTTKSKSDGIGLFAAKKAAEIIGAEISITSKQAKGTTAKALIPNMHRS